MVRLAQELSQTLSLSAKLAYWNRFSAEKHSRGRLRHIQLQPHPLFKIGLTHRNFGLMTKSLFIAAGGLPVALVLVKIS